MKFMITKKFKSMEFPNKENWQKWCQEGLCAEETAIIMGENPWENKETLFKRKTGELSCEKPETSAMVLGKEIRPLAIEAYKTLNEGLDLKPKNIQNLDIWWLRAHVDLMSSFPLHIAEIRCGEGSYEKAKNSLYPPKPYWAEAQHILATTGLKCINLFFYHPNTNTLEDKTPLVMTVWRKEEYISRMLREANLFMESVIQKRMMIENEIKLNGHAQAELALLKEKELARNVYQAVLGQAPKVDKSIYQKFVPSHFNKKGRLTPLGKSLLLS
jgi:putative phage-type endonuclease